MTREQFRQKTNKQQQHLPPRLTLPLVMMRLAINPTTTEVITPTVSAMSNYVTLQGVNIAIPTVDAATGGDEVVNPTTTKVITPTVSDSVSVTATVVVHAVVINPTVDAVTGHNKSYEQINK